MLQANTAKCLAWKPGHQNIVVECLKLRQLMADGELEFIQNGNRRLISEQAIWDYYNRAKTPARSVSGGC